MTTLPCPMWSLLLLAGALTALSAEVDRAQRLDALFREWNQPGTPGVSVAVIQAGKIVFEKGYGRANLEYNIAVTPETVYHAASVSKQFTAMALVLLEQDGKLSLDDDVHKVLPELPDYGQKLTIRQLLQHTSGIRDQWQTLGLAGWRLDDVITQAQILRLLFRQRELNFPPGTKHLYSNGGYTLAAEIVTRVSGQSLPDFCEERIFRPLGMNHTHFHLDHRRIVPSRAYSYEKHGDGYQALPLNYANVGATSLFTTAPDLARWLDNFRVPKVGGQAAIQRLQERGILADGHKIDYGLGVALGQYRGLKTVAHAGADAGYRSYVLWFPEQALGIAVVSGLASFDSTGVANKVAAEFLGDRLGAPVAKSTRQYVSLATKALGQYVGHYRIDNGLEPNIIIENDQLCAQMPGQWTFPLKPLATNRFYVEPLDGEVEFDLKPGGAVSIKVKQTGTVTTGERIGSVSVETPDLSAYAGVYWSDELETQYTIRVDGAKLFADHAHHGKIALFQAAKDRFTSGEWFMPNAVFLRDGTGRVTGLDLGGGRITAIHFTRK